MAILRSNNDVSYTSFLPQLTPPKLPLPPLQNTKTHTTMFWNLKTMKEKNMKAFTLLTLLLLCGLMMDVIARYFELQWWWLQVLSNPLLNKLLLRAILFWDPMMVAPSSKQSTIGWAIIVSCCMGCCCKKMKGWWLFLYGFMQAMVTTTMKEDDDGCYCRL